MENNEQIPEIKPEVLLEVVRMKMPYGKFRGLIICDLPISYLEWMLRKGGFPRGKLGFMLNTVYEIKLNGLEYLLEPLRGK
ncbi:MAG: DUF3820 family protein [Chitinophagaceae bacterium]|nr:DUF3820 family protein [Chitinophagaceae bacterium]